MEEVLISSLIFIFPFGCLEKLVQVKFGNRRRWIVIPGFSMCHTGTPGCGSSHSFGKIKPELYFSCRNKVQSWTEDWKSFTPTMKFLFGVTDNLCRGSICSKSNSDDGSWVTQSCAEEISSGSAGNLQLPRGQLCLDPAKVSGGALWPSDKTILRNSPVPILFPRSLI